MYETIFKACFLSGDFDYIWCLTKRFSHVLEVPELTEEAITMI